MYKWKVCPIQGRQLKDVREEDLYGDFRFCNTYRGGGGYDQFPTIAEARSLTCDGDMGLQFVVQLFGCPLDCYYCYVTRDGIFGKYTEYTTRELVGAYYNAYLAKNAGVFHLMGGAPALYSDWWWEILDELDENTIFHSDILLTEIDYNMNSFRKANRPNALYAVDIKGVSEEDYYRNTRRQFNAKRFWYNFYVVVDSGVDFYLTFTNPDPYQLEVFKERLVARYGDYILNDHFVIDLIDYEALDNEETD